MSPKKDLQATEESSELEASKAGPYKVKPHPDGGVVTVDKENQAAQLLATFGTTDLSCTQKLISQLVAIILGDKQPCEVADSINKLTPLLAGIGPRDELEFMLACQMVAGHHLSMDCMRRAALPGQFLEEKTQNLNQAVKLSKLFLEQITALDKHRGKAKQRVIVEHVTIAAGAQAIVGNVEQGGGKGEK